MFTQIAQAFRQPARRREPRPDGRPRRGVGASTSSRPGQSQSALRLRDYVGRVAARPPERGRAHRRRARSTATSAPPKPFPNPLSVPVINLLSDFEAVDDGVRPRRPPTRATACGRSPAPATATTSSATSRCSGHGPRVLRAAPKQTEAQYDATILAAGNYGERIEPELLACVVAGAAMPMRYATSSAHPPAARAGSTAGRRRTTAPASSSPTARWPRTQTATRSAASGCRRSTSRWRRYLSTTCALGGITVPFTDLQLQQLYGTHAEYYGQMADRTDAAVAGGWLLPDDAVDLMTRACAAKVRFPDSTRTCEPYTPPAYDTPLPSLHRALPTSHPRSPTSPAAARSPPPAAGPATRRRARAPARDRHPPPPLNRGEATPGARWRHAWSRPPFRNLWS